MQSVAELARCHTEGRVLPCSTYRKVPSQASVASAWVDLSMAAGAPPAQYYASNPLESAALEARRGVHHGVDQAPGEKFLANALALTPTAGLVGPYVMVDHLLYYPFLALDDADTQVMDNTLALPRYTDGDGVRMVLVTQAPTGGGETLTITYVNQDGVERTTPTIQLNTTSVGIASVPYGIPAVNNNAGLFVPLAGGDTGVRSVVSATVLNPVGGLAAIVLVRPLHRFVVKEANTPTEIAAITEVAQLPRIEDGAHINYFMRCAATVAAGLLAIQHEFVFTTGD